MYLLKDGPNVVLRTETEPRYDEEYKSWYIDQNTKYLDFHRTFVVEIAPEETQPSVID